MQALLVSTRCGAIVKVDLLETVSGSDLNATCQTILREIYSNGGTIADCCRVYLCKDGKLYLSGEESL